MEEAPKAKAHLFITLNDDSGGAVKLHPAQSGRRGNLVAATVPLGEVETLAARSDVAYVELGESLAQPVPEITNRAPALRTERGGGLTATIRKAEEC